VIRDAIMDNNFLKNLDTTQVREIVDCVYERRVKTGQFVIKEGDPGQHFYVAAGLTCFFTAVISVMARLHGVCRLSVMARSHGGRTLWLFCDPSVRTTW